MNEDLKAPGVRRLGAALHEIKPQLDWPHAPAHRLTDQGAYMITAGTYKKINLLTTPERLDLMLQQLFACALEFGWKLEAWAVMANHYHIVALSPENPRSLSSMLNKLHTTVSKALNLMDHTPGRRVWYQYWETHITFHRSFLARLNYVHQNPVHHKIVRVPSAYQWCSAAWFERSASPAFVKTVSSFKADRIRVVDDF
jgi:putative transposase